MKTPPPMPRLDQSAGDWIPPIEYCPVSIGTSVMGDRWSLLIVRELLLTEAGFNDISRMLPGLSRTLLSSRLKYLQKMGVLELEPEEPGLRNRKYRLTPVGLALRPVLEAFGIWALGWQSSFGLGGDETGMGRLLWHMRQGLDHSALPENGVAIAFVFPGGRPSNGWIQAKANRSSACVGHLEDDIDLRVTVEPAVLHQLWWGERQCEDARRAGDIGFEGADGYAERFRTWFGGGALQYAG